MGSILLMLLQGEFVYLILLISESILSFLFLGIFFSYFDFAAELMIELQLSSEEWMQI